MMKKIQKIGIYMHERFFIILHIVLTRKLILYSSSYGSSKKIHTYLIPKPNYLTSFFLITTSFPTNFPYTSLLSLCNINMDLKNKLICFFQFYFFMSLIFVSIQTKFDIDINNDELLETIWEQKKI